MAELIISSELPRNDVVLLRNLADDIQRYRQGSGPSPNPTAKSPEKDVKEHSPSGQGAAERAQNHYISPSRDEIDLARMRGLNDPINPDFEPTIFSSVDLRDLSSRLHPVIYDHILLPYISWAQRIARHETDVVMITHLIIYFTTSVPSAIWLFYNFTYLHGILHFVMQFYYMGTYTLMMHQHIHTGGILNKQSHWLRIFDLLFPYITDPLMGHTWNSYYYHHVKHHHVEGNGPDDLSSTIRFQRDNIWHLLHYIGRFYFFVWLDLPIYFLRKNRLTTGLKAAFWELSDYAALLTLFRFNSKATLFVFLMPFMLMRLGLMVGNWGQHAFVDADEPDSDYRSSITLIDVPSNRYCYNDGYHTSHHLNPRRHWREHPVHFLQNKESYSREHALLFHNIDYLMITVRLMLHDYEHLARCLVPLGDQIGMTMGQRVAMLKRHTRRFSEAEIREKFGTAKAK
ncbi:fatty acid desaturase [Xylariaceae sp. FL0662B]|nr:fatty acid desaturase [Xylariaceae sp. FL0662B]